MAESAPTIDAQPTLLITTCIRVPHAETSPILTAVFNLDVTHINSLRTLESELKNSLRNTVYVAGQAQDSEIQLIRTTLWKQGLPDGDPNEWHNIDLQAKWIDGGISAMAMLNAAARGKSDFLSVIYSVEGATDEETEGEIAGGALLF